MGTNYYWRYNACTCCGRHDELHVGKSSSGFRGHFVQGPDSFEAQPAIVSWATWKLVLRGEAQALTAQDRPGGELWDEYGVRLDVEEFIAEREATTREFRGRQHQWLLDHPDRVDVARIGRVEPGGDWLDADGWSFHGGEFS